MRAEKSEVKVVKNGLDNGNSNGHAQHEDEGKFIGVKLVIIT